MEDDYNFLSLNFEKNIETVSEELERGIDSHACAWKSNRLSLFQKPKATIYISSEFFFVEKSKID